MNRYKISKMVTKLAVVAVATGGLLSAPAIYAASQLGVQNVNTTTFVLTGVTGDAASYCGTGSQPGACFNTLSPAGAQPGGAQWATVSDYMQFDYDVCSSANSASDKAAPGKAACGGYIGHVGVKFTPAATTLNGVSGGQATLGPWQAGKPFALTFTPAGPTYQYPATPSSYSSIPYRGVNLAGAEYDYATNPPNLQDGAFYAAKGMNTIRLPFKWEYLQSNSTDPKVRVNDPSVAIDFNNPNAKAYLALVNSYISKGMTVIVDMHNYMRYGSNEAVIGSGNPGAPSAQQYANAWVQVANQFKNNPKVMFDLMNEPNSMPTELVLKNYNVVMPAIRSAGANNLILLEGNSWSGAHNWNNGSTYGTANSLVFIPSAINDPMNNYAINVHQYFDPNYSGTADCVPNAVPNINGLTNYLKQYQLKAIITELGGFNTQVCAGDIDKFLGALPAYQPGQGGYIGWTGWAGGAKATVLSTYFGFFADGSQTVTMTNGFQYHLTLPQAQ